jgi:sialidase-1
MLKKTNLLFIVFALITTIALGQERQSVEGLDKVVFHYNVNRLTPSRDFRGMAPGYMTAGWWAAGQMENNYVSWQTASVPAKKTTTFYFIAATCILPSEIAMGPSAKLSVNGKYALSFTLGMNRNFNWKEGDYELKYISKRVEYPYFGSHRELELNGNSGIYQLTVPASAIEEGQSALLQVNIESFPRWQDGWFMVKDRKDVLKQSMETLEGEVEVLRQDMATVNQQTHMLATQVYSKMLGTDKFEHEVVYTDGYRHLHPADLIKLQNGDILITAREATEHYANDGDVIMLRSKDQGKTWGDKQVIAGIKDVDEREGCGIQLKDGTIVVGVFYNNLYSKDGSYGFNSAERKLIEPNKHYLGAYIITSKDNGKTWSEPNYIETTGMPFLNIEGPTDAPIEMPDGSLLMGVIGYNFKGDPLNRSSVMLQSTDKGRSWKYLSTIAGDPGGKLGGFLEPGIARTKSGRIVAALRNHASENAIWTTYSDDNGKTWEKVQKTDMHGHPADIIQLSDGRLLMSYGIRTSHARPAGVRACFSNDNGKTWDINTEVQIRNDFINWDVGYPESLQLADGRVLTVYYYNLFGKYFLGGTYWKP